MIMLSKLFFYVSVGMLSILGCSKKESSIEKQVSKIVDSLSADKKYSNKLFIVQYQSKWNKSYIKVSTAEFFDKDSVTHYTYNNENLIVYYSNFFRIKKEKKKKRIAWISLIVISTKKEQYQSSIQDILFLN